MAWPHNRNAPTNPNRPEPTGYCDRCGFLYPLAQLSWQYQWAGPRTFNTNLRVCPRDLDDLQENGFRTIVIGPDPKPLKHPRPPQLPPDALAPVAQQFVLDDPDADLLDSGDYLG